MQIYQTAGSIARCQERQGPREMEWILHLRYISRKPIDELDRRCYNSGRGPETGSAHGDEETGAVKQKLFKKIYN